MSDRKAKDGNATECLTISVPEAAEMLGIGRVAAYAAAKRGDIPTLQIGRRVVVPRERFFRMISGDAATA